MDKASDKTKLSKDNYNNIRDPNVISLVNDKQSLSPKELYEVENLRFNKNIVRHQTSSTREWGNSVYLYNKNYIKNLPLVTSRLDNILTSYFNFNFNYLAMGNKSKSTDILEKKYSLNKTLVSKSEVKVTSDKVNLTVYIYNRNKLTLLKSYLYSKKTFPLVNKINLNKILKSYSNFSLAVINHIEEIRKGLELKINKKEKREKDFLKRLDNKLGRKIIIKFFVDYFNNLYVKKMLKVYYIRKIVINNTKFKNWFMLGLKKTLTKLYNKKVELNIVNQKYYYLNSDIFTKTIATRVRDRNNRVAHVINNALANISLANLKANYSSKIKKASFLKDFSKRLSLKIFNDIKYKNIKGVRIEAAGRLTKRLTAARSLAKDFSKGNLKANEKLSFSLIRGNSKPNVQYTNLNTKTRNGAFGLKGWVNSN